MGSVKTYSKGKYSQIRLVMESAGELYKFFWMNFDKNDDSLYFNFYPLKNQSDKMKHGVTKPNVLAHTVSFPDEDSKESIIKSGKYSYHRSGFIHLTLKDGTVMERGLQFLPFDKIGDFARILILIPNYPHKYPKVKEEQLKKGNNIIIHTRDFEDEVFSVEIFFMDKAISHERVPSIARVYRDIDAETDKYPFKIMIRISTTNKPWQNHQILVFPTTDVNSKLTKLIAIVQKFLSLLFDKLRIRNNF